ncbi:MAG: ABC transporter ATP-binding protein [Planctomycetota bacterium]
MYRSLLQTSRPLLKHKGQLALASVGLLIMSIGFGAGLGLMLPVFNLLLKEGRTLADLIGDTFTGTLLEPFGNWLAGLMPTDPFYAFIVVMAAVLIMTLISGLGRLLHTYLIARVTSRVIQHWRVTLYRQMIRMSMGSSWTHSINDGLSRIMNDIPVLYSGYRGILVRSPQAAVKVVMALMVALLVNWQLTLLALVGGPVIVLVVRKLGKSVRKATKLTLEANAEMLLRINESFGDLRVIKMSQSEGSESRRFYRATQKAFREHVRQHRARAVSSMVVELLAMVGVGIVAVISAWSIFRQGVPGSEFMMILAALVAAGTSFRPLSNLHHDLTAADAAGQRLLELHERVEPDTTQPDAAQDQPSLPRHRDTVRFEALTYTYPGASTPALDDITLDVAFGEFVAVVGGNGSGKSTLVSALARLITPDSGRVLIDGQDIAEHDLRSVRSQLAMVTQKTRLFKGTIADNIAYGRTWSDPKDITDAARIATADLFIDEMPAGYETPIGEGGEGVSGGQAQRICIARAVLRDPAILILDEATSQVDTSSESLIADAIERISEGRTTFVIAHRMSTIINADRIIVMDAGRIVAQGKHHELLENCPEYEALARGQLINASS